ncbi:MAG: response regulator [Acidobacteriota bacterium]|nr:response regulator [Acidobacteriota bacterium]
MRVIQAAAAYIVVYLAAAALAGETAAGTWLRAIGPLIPAIAAVAMIARRRAEWQGAQAVFWMVIAAGLTLWSVGHVGFVYSNLASGSLPQWLDWHTSFSLVGGGAAPFLAFLARPHRGRRPFAVPAIILDIASLAVLFLFSYAYFVLAPNAGESPRIAERSLQVVIVVQRFLVLGALGLAAWSARHTAYGRVFTGLFAALTVGFVFRSALSVQVVNDAMSMRTLPQAVLDLAWIVPYFGWTWAAYEAPASASAGEPAVPEEVPWWPSAVCVAIIPAVGYGVRLVAPLGAPIDGFRDLLTAFATVVGVVLLSARLASQRGDLRRSDARARLLAAAVEQTDSLVMVVRKNGTIEHANAAMLRALGYETDSLGERRFSDTVTSPQSGFGDVVASTIKSDGIWRGTFKRRRLDGTTFPVAATVVPLVGAGGEPSHFVGVERDITDDLRVREELVRAERLSAMGELVAGVAHEINNPLQAIVGCAEILSETVSDPGIQRDVALIRTEASRAREIVRSLLSFVHRRPTERVPTDLNEIIREAMSLRGYHLKQKGVAMDVVCAADLPRALANPDEIRQLVLNLLLNAEHAVSAAPGPQSITLSSGRVPDSETVYLEVSDSGPGVPEHVRHRIFEPFFTTKEVGEGTGLGLSISHGIAAAHGGRLDLRPADIGACFRVVLPTTGDIRAADADARVAAPKVPVAEGDRVALIVDDEHSVRSLVMRLLERRGYRVVEAEDGEAALRTLESHSFDLVLCDVRMPRLSGRMLFETLEARLPDLSRRFVLMSGDTLSADVADFAAARGVTLLTKPFTARELDGVLEQIR